MSLSAVAPHLGRDPDVAEKIQVVDTAAVGDHGVHEVLERGAVDRVQTETRISAEAELIDTVGRQGGEVTVFSHEFDPGQQLSNLGGVAALLRYRLD